MTEFNQLAAGIVLLTVIGIAYGGTFLLTVVNGAVPANTLQRNYFRAGHAHAGVLVTLGLLVQVVLATPNVPSWAATLGSGVLWSAILIPAGFFLSVIGKDPEKPNAWKYSIWLGAAALTVGLAGAGVGLITASAS